MDHLGKTSQALQLSLEQAKVSDAYYLFIYTFFA